MILTKPSYFDDFRCIASACPDSCCKEWSVQVDDHAAAFYRSLPGELGERLRQVLKEENGDTVLEIENGRCPMWRTDGLCRIQAELGERALCRTCREFPRLRHDYGDFVELGLELSCPEAARIILSSTTSASISEILPGDETPEYDEEAMSILKATRAKALSILDDRQYDVPSALSLFLLYGCQAQSELDGAEAQPFDPHSALEEIAEFAKPADLAELSAFFSGLEILTEEWALRLQSPSPGPWTDEYRRIARYFAERYWLQAVSDYDLYCRVKFIILSCLLIRYLGGNLLRTAQLYSKEIENNIDNVEAILDAAYTHPAFTDDKLFGSLRKA